MTDDDMQPVFGRVLTAMVTPWSMTSATTAWS